MIVMTTGYLATQVGSCLTDLASMGRYCGLRSVEENGADPFVYLVSPEAPRRYPKDSCLE